MNKKNTSLSLVHLFFLLLPFSSLALKLSPQLSSLISLKTSLSASPFAFQDWKVTDDQNDAVWCSWSGVVCDNATSQVISLDLSNRNLTGNLPQQIRYLSSSLLYLNLSKNSLEVRFPLLSLTSPSSPLSTSATTPSTPASLLGSPSSSS